MGKRLIQQRRGKGSPTFTSPSHRFRGRIRFRSYDKNEKEGIVKGVVSDIMHDPGHTAPVAVLKYETGEEIILPAASGLKVGQEIEAGAEAESSPGNIMPVGKIPEGTPIFNIEFRPGDGGKAVRSSGSFGYLVSHEEKVSVVRLPSGSFKRIRNGCRAAIGAISGFGRTEKPLVKAGNAVKKHKAKGKYYPIVSANKKNAVDHPFGGGGHKHSGKPETVSRKASPGRKVGLISASRTGRKGRKKRK